MPSHENSERCVGRTLNLDVAGLSQRISRFMDEALKCQSSNTASMNSHDMKRLRDYLQACVNYKGWVTASTEPLDTPEFHPTELATSCAALPKIDSIENESVKDWCRLMYVCHYELVNSQSSRSSSGLISHDAERFDSYIERCDRFLTDYVETTLPLDLPETVPMRPSVTPGNRGIGV